MNNKARILFIGEAVSLAHVTRPFQLASGLDANLYHLHLAWDEHFAFVARDSTLDWRHLPSLSPAAFRRRLAWGQPLYSFSELKCHLLNDLDLLDAIKPDLVVGDFRLSLAVSARLRHIPYATITNAYWSPFTIRKEFPLPELVPNRFFGLRIMEALTSYLQPFLFRQHARPHEQLRLIHGRSPMEGLLGSYTEADFVFYDDLPSLARTENLPQNHYYLGPIPWTPAARIAESWREKAAQIPAIYASLGSTGPAERTNDLIKALAPLPVFLMLATAARAAPKALPDNAVYAEFVPGTEASRLARLVITNGGSGGTYQALSAGVPVLGICSNMDQFLMMEDVCRRGAGIMLRASKAKPAAIREAAIRLLEEPQFKLAAQEIAAEAKLFNAQERFRRFVDGYFFGGESSLRSP